MSYPAGVSNVLADMRQAIAAGKFLPINRVKNLQTLAQLGLSWDDVKDEIYTLQESHYHRGPMIDRDNPASDHLWEFKKVVCGQLIYIKFKVLYAVDGSVKVVSFHIDGQ